MTSHSKSIITTDPTSVVKRTSEEAQLKDLSQSESTTPATNNPIINYLDFSAAQVETMDQSQRSDMDPKEDALEVNSTMDLLQLSSKGPEDISPDKVKNSTTTSIHHA